MEKDALEILLQMRETLEDLKDRAAALADRLSELEAALTAEEDIPEPEEPVAEPEEAAVEPGEPVADPEKPVADPEPVAEPEEPVVEAEPVFKPDPFVDPGPPFDLEVPEVPFEPEPPFDPEFVIEDGFTSDVPYGRETNFEPVFDAINDVESEKIPTAVNDAFAGDFAWKTDIPGSEVRNIISGISLNDRILFVNTLFRGDPELFQRTLAQLNSMESFSEAVALLSSGFPEWKLGSEVVYRFMMAVRRKVRS